MDRELLDVKQAADILGVTGARVRQLCGDGLIGTKVGSRWLIYRDDLEAFMSSPNRDRRKRQEEAADG